MIDLELRDKYAKFLNDNSETVRAFYPVLSKNQRKFFDVILHILRHPESKRKEIAESQKVHQSTVKRAAGCIRSMALPFRYTLWMDCKRIEYETRGNITAQTIHALMLHKNRKGTRK